ncbi:hypothetical protein P775_07530 [Puniceibacterium antarcticum]|uniref:HTH deoR-type domain-containing protein n=1 Tax=Puniceibacterium antarcticum TaxID=1206336 RepID=A0A2G8RGV6_9RHOB|nr:YafY family protein [Puniceibacterium antarcticum]PIL20815.1 hypothetical protein P775_07530 [Puniceibacterium antarcticum]
MSRTHRLFQLMQALRALPTPATAQQLADETGVSERTLYRDIDALRGLGAVIDGAAGFGYTLIEDATLPPLGFQDEELEALVLGLREVMQVGDPALAKAAQGALDKLRARLPDRQAHRLRHAVLSAHRFARPKAPLIDAGTLRRAVWAESHVRFAYRDAAGSATTREVQPLGIVYFESSHCLLARCLLRQDFRSFRLDRMTGLEVLQDSFRPNRVSLLREYMEQLRNPENPFTPPR